VTVITSSSIRSLNWEAGKPAAEATLTVVWLAVIAELSIVEAPGPTRQMYDVEGVRSKTALTLASRAG
jgi:hypothetical protein